MHPERDVIGGTYRQLLVVGGVQPGVAFWVRSILERALPPNHFWLGGHSLTQPSAFTWTGPYPRLGTFMKPLQKFNIKVKSKNVANGAKETIDNKQKGVLKPNMHFRESTV